MLYELSPYIDVYSCQECNIIFFIDFISCTFLISDFISYFY